MSTAIVSQPVQRVVPADRWPLRLIIRWHLLSLDAPSVAVAWLFLLNRGLPEHQLKVEAAALAIAVWAIYVLDRILDARRQDEALHSRHYFHLRYRRIFLSSLAVLLPLFAVLVWALPADVRCVWIALSIPLAIYAFCVQLFGSRVPKEFIVGAFFAIVVGAPSMCSGEWTHAVPAMVTFGLLCCWNCLAITLWETGTVSGRQGAGSPDSALGRITLLLVGAALLCLLSSDKAAGCASLLSIALLLWLHRNRNNVGPVLLRSLADAALLSPLPVLALLYRK